MTIPRRLLLDHAATPLGELALLADDTGHLHALGWTSDHTRMERHLQRLTAPAHVTVTRAPDPGGLTTALLAYFAGDLTAIDALPVALEGTPFQRTVWRALREIPCGETCSYLDLARRIGNPAAVRAVGLANGANPIGVVIPCHRVIGANGTLTGYGGGLERKRWLLAHEARERRAPPLGRATPLDRATTDSPVQGPSFRR